MKTAWELKNAPASLERESETRLTLLEECIQNQCVTGCNGLWLTCAKQVLDRNGISSQSFSNAIKLLLDKGRGKYRNTLIVGPANCGKMFILNPLWYIYNTFRNPATSTFAWVGAETAEIILHNNFR